MIEKLSISNFKCLDNKEFELGKINLFSGFNGRGKSTVLQSLLLIAQSLNRSCGSFYDMHIKGELADLGGFSEIQGNEENPIIEFGFKITDSEDDPKSIKLKYSENSNDFTRCKIADCEINGESILSAVGSVSGIKDDTQKEVASIPKTFEKPFNNIQFISAERIGPRKYEDKLEVPDVHIIDSKGENSYNTLKSYTEQIPASMNISAEDTESHTLEDSVSQWMSHIMTGGDVNSKDQMDGQLISVKFGIDPVKKRNFNSYNVGFGYSYVLSIIESALIAKEDSILIIENPEAHLHGKAQSRLTELLAKAAARGVQVYVESHSEHIINGFRLQILREKIPELKEEDLYIYFFDQNFEITPLKMEKDGNIKGWPKNFFDQEMQDLAEIMLLSAKRADK